MGLCGGPPWFTYSSEGFFLCPRSNFQDYSVTHLLTFSRFIVSIFHLLSRTSSEYCTLVGLSTASAVLFPQIDNPLGMQTSLFFLKTLGLVNLRGGGRGDIIIHPPPPQPWPCDHLWWKKSRAMLDSPACNLVHALLGPRPPRGEHA